MNRKNSIRMTFLAAAVMIMAACVMALPAYDEGSSDAAPITVGGIAYNTLGTMGNIGTAEIIANSALPYGYTGNFTILEKVTSSGVVYTITAIGASAFMDCAGLTSVTMPSSVITIGNSAFQNCAALKSIVIPAGITAISDCAFSGCTSLASVTIPNSVTSIGNSAFSGCTPLASVVIPNSVTSIGAYTFFGCVSLASVTLPAAATVAADTFNTKVYTLAVTDYTTNLCLGKTTAPGIANFTAIGGGTGTYSHIILAPKTQADAITIDTTPYRVVGKTLTITAKPTNVTVTNFAPDWQINTPYTWSGTAWAPAQLVTWTLDANRTVTTVATAGAAPEYYWAPPSGFVGWSPSLAVGTYAYTATYSQPDVPPVDPVPAPTEPAKKVDMAQILLWSCVGLALICGLAYAVTRHPAAGVIALLSVVALILLYAGYLPWKL